MNQDAQRLQHQIARYSREARWCQLLAIACACACVGVLIWAAAGLFSGDLAERLLRAFFRGLAIVIPFNAGILAAILYWAAGDLVAARRKELAAGDFEAWLCELTPTLDVMVDDCPWLGESAEIVEVLPTAYSEMFLEDIHRSALLRTPSGACFLLHAHVADEGWDFDEIELRSEQQVRQQLTGERYEALFGMPAATATA